MASLTCPGASNATGRCWAFRKRFLRTTISGRSSTRMAQLQCVAVRLDSQLRDFTRLDWRSDMVAPLKPALVALPRAVEERCIALMRKLGLAFGCIDLIVTPEGEHIFLEVNEMGQFLWVEQDEPRSELLRCFATLLLNRQLGPSS